jgi:hypothetical protein
VLRNALSFLSLGHISIEQYAQVGHPKHNELACFCQCLDLKPHPQEKLTLRVLSLFFIIKKSVLCFKKVVISLLHHPCWGAILQAKAQKSPTKRHAAIAIIQISSEMLLSTGE